MEKPLRIAFVELWRLGDAVAATAGLSALLSAQPGAEIAIVAHPEHGEPLFRLLPNAYHVPFAAFWTRGKLATDKYLPWTIDYVDLWRVWRRLRRFRADAYLLFRGDIREQIFFSTLGSDEIVDFGSRFIALPWVRRVPRPGPIPRFGEFV